MKTVLITGGAGFIGANFVHYWMQHYPQDKVVVIDALTYAGNLASLDPVKDQPNFTFVKGNICDTELVEKLLAEHKVDTLVHFAAESHVDRSITGPDEFIETNIIGTYSLLKAAKKVWLDQPAAAGKPPVKHRFHHVSTDEVYGTLSATDPAFTENTAYAPNSPHSASKAASDHLVRAYHHTYGLEVTTSNCSNNYGPYHFPEKLVPVVILNALAGKDIPVYGKGENIRDWLYVEDHADALLTVLAKGEVGRSYNIGGENEAKNIDLVRMICAHLDVMRPKDTPYAKQITFVTDRPGHDMRYAIDPTRIRTELGWRPSVTLEEGLEKTVRWYLDNEDWWRALQSRSGVGDRLGTG